MRLSEWRTKAPVKDALGARVLDVVVPVLGVLDVEADPQAWVHWGDDPGSRYTIYAPIVAGLVVVAVRTMGASGPRATAKMIRWSRLQLGELSVETEGSHRMISFQLESTVLRGADEVADAVGRFALVVLAAVEGRPWPAFDAPSRRRPVGRAAGGAATRSSAKGGSAKSAKGRSATSPASERRTPGADRRAGKVPSKLPALTAGAAPSAPGAPSAPRSRA
jgi:hypothetical protein